MNEKNYLFNDLHIVNENLVYETKLLNFNSENKNPIASIILDDVFYEFYYDKGKYFKKVVQNGILKIN